MTTKKTKTPASTSASAPAFEPPTRPAAVGEGRSPQIDPDAAEARDAALESAAEGAAAYERERADWLAAQEADEADVVEEDAPPSDTDAPPPPATDAPPAGDGAQTKDA